MEAEEPLQPSRRVTLREGQRLRITGLSLVDPAAANGQPVVRVWAEVGHEQRVIGTLSSSEEGRITRVRPPLELVDGEFVLCHDSASSSVRLYGHYLDPPDPDGEGVPTRSQFAVDIGVDEMGEDEEYELLTEESLVERYDSDHGDEDEDAGVDMALVAAPAGLIVLDGVSLGPPRFAAVKNTAGFMRIAAAEAATTGSHHEGSREIVVLYRYTRFSRTWSGRRGVEACRRTKMHWLRFAVPPAGDMASSLAWAGASLSPLIYPRLFRRELRDLWSNLAAPAVTAAIPPRAARLQVVVDAGILRREDHTAERMEHMRGALEDIMGEAWPEYYHVGMELHLPEPVRRREDDTGGDEDGAPPPPPAKRRRIITEEVEECSLCLDPLESGLAAWPGCGHVFHGECVEETLAGRETCPLCRHLLSDELVCYC
uniref:RING-type domain-containing protein n=1 Tax=Setaria viridis TaxID=4556 RepID=A0A4U6U376_SETVI|nr:hypothetical protein SEVIR_6G042800v2 [Setaria viridis]